MGFAELPTRLFLDSNILQLVAEYGGVVFENEELPEGDRIHQVTEGPESLDALRMLFTVAERGPFEFIVSENSLREAADKNDRRHLQWVVDVSHHSEVCLAENGAGSDATHAQARKLLQPSFGYLSAKDRAMLADAVALDCDVFLTMDLKLAKNADRLREVVGIQVLTPQGYAEQLRPWVRLFC